MCERMKNKCGEWYEWTKGIWENKQEKRKGLGALDLVMDKHKMILKQNVRFRIKQRRKKGGAYAIWIYEKKTCQFGYNSCFILCIIIWKLRDIA